MKEKVLAMAKERGLEIAEESAKDLVELSLELVGIAVEETENSIDDLVYASLKSRLKAYLLSKAEDINKADNE